MFNNQQYIYSLAKPTELGTKFIYCIEILNIKYMTKMYLYTKYVTHMYLNTKYEIRELYLNTLINTF